jgi:thiol-disulfide isomerase/thioredoxin
MRQLMLTALVVTAMSAPTRATELASLSSATGWINSPPLTEEGLRGKVVLVQFWTYSCVNWLRTLP